MTSLDEELRKALIETVWLECVNSSIKHLNNLPNQKMWLYRAMTFIQHETGSRKISFSKFNKSVKFKKRTMINLMRRLLKEQQMNLEQFEQQSLIDQSLFLLQQHTELRFGMTDHVSYS